MNTKNLTFAIMMGALGTALFAISFYAPIAPSVAFDLSLLGVLIAGYYGGPKVGFLTGLIAGILPGIIFGPLGSGGVLGLIALPFGKGLTGLSAGLISSTIKLNQKPRLSLLAIPSTFTAYIPEALFTWGYFFLILMDPATGTSSGTFVFSTVILPKALIEVGIISIIMVVLLRSKSFSSYVKSHFFQKNEIKGNITGTKLET